MAQYRHHCSCSQDLHNCPAHQPCWPQLASPPLTCAKLSALCKSTKRRHNTLRPRRGKVESCRGQESGGQMSPQNRVDTPRPRPAPAPAPHCCRHTASDNICRVPGDTGHSVASLGAHTDEPQNIKNLYNLWVQEKHL